MLTTTKGARTAQSLQLLLLLCCCSYHMCTLPPQERVYVIALCVVLQTNALCNVLGARTNNRVLQPLNDRTIHLGGIQGITAS